MIIDMDGESYMTLDEVMKKLCVSQGAIQAGVRMKNFPEPTRLPFRMVWKVAEIDEYAKKRNKVSES